MNSILNPIGIESPWELSFGQVTTDYDSEYQVLNVHLNPEPRPSFSPSLLQDIKTFQTVISEDISREIAQHGQSSIKYVMHVSDIPGIWNLGGDLGFFIDTIRANDRQTLADYAYLSIDVLYANLVNFRQPVNTITVLEGAALGAGFEAALSCDYIVAERDVQLGFPEVVFNMFPGMGAYSFLARRLSPFQVEKMIASGRIYTAEELHEMGVIDVLAEPGNGRIEAADFIRKHQKNRITNQGVLRMRERVFPIHRQELLDIADIWVDSAFSLSDKDLRMMERLVKAQDRRLRR